jgi:hypothetical protein
MDPSGEGGRAPSAGSRPGEGAVRFSHSGFQYVLGFGVDFFGIWERDRPGAAVERFPRTDQGWVEAWNRFRTLEPRAVEVTAPGGGDAAGSSGSGASQPPGGPEGGGDAGPGTGGVAPARSEAAGPKIGEGALRFSHSGVRYILGYGQGFFGIWDRETPGGPTMQFPRTDQGWTEAWNRFTAWEPRAVEVPQGTQPPDVRSAPHGEFRSGHALAMWVVGLISLSMVVSVIGAALWGGHLSDLGAFERGARTVQQIQDSKDAALGVNAAILWVILAAGIVWLIWQHRSHANLRALGAGGLKYSPGWAVGWWFVPFANIVLPFLTMRELWKASEPEAGSIDWIARRTTPILGLWWAGRLVTQILLQIGIAFDNNLRSIGDLRAEGWFFVAGDVVLVIWGVLAILLVRSIDGRQAKKRERVVEWTRGFAQPA